MKFLHALLITIFAALVYTDLSANNNYVDQMVQSNYAVVIEFMRPTCPYCKYLTPLFTQLSQLYAQQHIVFKIIDTTSLSSDIKNHYNLQTVPTVIYFKNGSEQRRHGSNNKTITLDDMKKIIDAVYL